MSIMDKILSFFRGIARIPHGSGNEDMLRTYLFVWAKKNGFLSYIDNAGNLVVRVPATSGYENSPIVVLQCHMDMVCEPQEHDWSKPIELVFEGNILKANGTSLGADNGMGIVLAMLAATEGVAHPPLELLFTVEEEVGLRGAKKLQPGFLKGQTLINLDSEKFGEITTGCAGGQRTTFKLDAIFDDISHNARPFRIVVDGLKGGHSALAINSGGGNAIKILARVLHATQNQTRVADINGGTRMNVIPNRAEAVVYCSPENVKDAEGAVSHMRDLIKNELKITDPGIRILFESISDAPLESVLDEFIKDTLINVLLGIYHGVWVMSDSTPGAVETSTNLATIKLDREAQSIVIETMQRSSKASRLEEVVQQATSVAELSDMTIKPGDAYTGWEPNPNSPLLAKCKAVFKDTFGKEPVITETHGGLECGAIAGIFEGMDMVSFGPTMEDVHSVKERVDLESVEKTWQLLAALLGAMK
jgi:dipeptidase D